MISTGRLVRSLVRSVAMGLLAGEIVCYFLDLFDQIGDFWHVTWAVMGLFADDNARELGDGRRMQSPEY